MANGIGDKLASKVRGHGPASANRGPAKKVWDKARGVQQHRQHAVTKRLNKVIGAPRKAGEAVAGKKQEFDTLVQEEGARGVGRELRYGGHKEKLLAKKLLLG
tara:strand:+ start:45 stop:353 length:309 start_codon:yes stop_codon:yes gene_type:complete